MYATDRKQSDVLWKLQRELNSIDTCASAGTIISMEIKLVPSASLIGFDHLRFISH
jgi:hypothetical protein